ncbi:MAG: MarR family transcriptional regulator [Ignavibacteriales bacterium]|nr:MAG: MarR family transcriptional regulator [Ignavibacteriales bacterium]
MGEVLKRRLKQSKFSSNAQEAVLNLFVTSYHLRGKFEEIFVRYGITTPQYNVLRILKGVFPEGYPRCEIIDRMIEPAPDVTRLVDKLIKEKLVERYSSDTDKRYSLTRITKKGLKLLEDILPEVQKLDAVINRKLSADELSELSMLCEKIYGDELSSE